MHTAITNEALITQLFDAQPETVLWLKPVWLVDTTIADFEMAYSNDGASRFFGVSKTQLSGSNLRHHTQLDEAYTELLFEKSRQVWQTGQPNEESTYLPAPARYLNILCSKVMEGVLVIIRDHTAFYLSEQAHQQQTQLLNGILDASINGVFYCQAVRNEAGAITDLQFLKINKGFTRMINKTEVEVVGKSYLSLFPTAKETGLFDLNCQVIETGAPVRKQIYYDGEGLRAWYDVSLVKMNDGLVVTFADITSSKQNQNAILQSEARLRTIINTSQSGMFTLTPIKDAQGEVTDFCFGIVNQTVAAYIGEKAENLAGALASKYFSAYKTNGLFDIYKDTYLTGQVRQFDFHYEDDLDVYFDIHSVKTGDEVLVTFTDHTALKKLQVQLEQSIEDLQRSNANLQEFAYAASHDLQEPLRKIHFFSERLYSSIGPLLKEEDKRIFERMESATTRMRTLIDDLLSYSKLSMPTAGLEEVALQEVVQGVLADLEPSINEKGATITVDALPVVKGDGRQLQQLFQNVLSNALKYSKPHTPPVITIQYQTTELKQATTPQTFHCIAISDNGIGFEQQYAERIFQVFQRLHGKSEYPGTGVGLAIAQKVVINHHGFIKAKGVPGEGATFSIYLPV